MSKKKLNKLQEEVFEKILTDYLTEDEEDEMEEEEYDLNFSLEDELTSAQYELIGRAFVMGLQAGQDSTGYFWMP